MESNEINHLYFLNRNQVVAPFAKVTLSLSSYESV